MPPMDSVHPEWEVGPDEFRLLLEFRPSVGPAKRIFKFYSKWLDATTRILNDYARHVHKGLSFEIQLQEIRSGSADPKFVIKPRLVTESGTVDIPQESFLEMMGPAQEIITASQDFLVETLDDGTYLDFYRHKMISAGEIGARLSERLQQRDGLPMEALPTLQPGEAALLPVLVEAPETSAEDEEQQQAQIPRSVVGALKTIAEAATVDLVVNEVLIQRSPDGEETRFTQTQMRESPVHTEETHEEIIEFVAQRVTTLKAIIRGSGKWGFLWDGKRYQMEVIDMNWLQDLGAGAVSINGGEALIVDITKKVKTIERMGMLYKRKTTYTITRVHNG